MLAGVNLAVTIPVILWSESWDAAYLRDHPVRNITAAETPANVPPATSGEQGVVFDRCTMTDQYTLQESIMTSGNAPAAILTGWRSFCPPPWSLSGRLRIDGGRPPTQSSIAAQRKVDLAIFLLIPLQWVLVGSFPLRRPKKPWGEPGAFITVCCVLAAALFFIPLHTPVLIPFLHWLALFPILCAFCAWCIWFCLLIWTVIRFGWTTVRRPAMITEP